MAATGGHVGLCGMVEGVEQLHYAFQRGETVCEGWSTLRQGYHWLPFLFLRGPLMFKLIHAILPLASREQSHA